MTRVVTLAAIVMMASTIAAPAWAQSYGYGAAPPPPPPPPPPGYAAPPPPPPPGYERPGAHCSARFESGQPMLCRMRVAKPVGAPCRCIAEPPPPGYPPEPPLEGQVVR